MESKEEQQHKIKENYDSLDSDLALPIATQGTPNCARTRKHNAQQFIASHSTSFHFIVCHYNSFHFISVNSVSSNLPMTFRYIYFMLFPSIVFHVEYFLQNSIFLIFRIRHFGAVVEKNSKPFCLFLNCQEKIKRIEN